MDSYGWIFTPRYSDSSNLENMAESVVRFESWDYKRAGEYTCEVTNEAGVNSASESVLVECK